MMKKINWNVVCAIVKRGLSEANGSWKMSCIWRRNGRIRPRLNPVMLAFLKVILPPSAR